MSIRLRQRQPDKPSRQDSRTRVRVIRRDFFDGAYGDVLKNAEEFASRQIEDPFAKNYIGATSDATQNGHLQPLPPPYNPDLLERVVHINNTLPQCVAAMITNCELTGHTLVYVGEKGSEKSAEAESERKFAENFLKTPNGKDSLRAIRRKLRHDLENLGYWFMEVGRNKAGEIRWFDYIPGKLTRICGIDLQPVLVERWVMRENGYEKIKVKQMFRRYVQIVGGRKVYFKEYGDPRTISPKTGLEDNTLKFEDSASEIVHHCIYPVEGYGVPRWANNIPAALGSRECELVNLQFFKDNTIPAMAILVSGGYLTQETIDDMQANFGSHKGRESMNRVLVIEARPDEEAIGDTSSAPPVPSLSMQPLGATRQSDELFTGYDTSNQDKLRSSFRLPPIFIGRSNDYTYATASASVEVTERQVFGPERQDFDDIVNMKLLVRQGKPLQFYQFRSNVSKITDTATILQVLTMLMQFGGGTPNLCIQIARELYDANLPMIEEEWGNAPWAIVQNLIATQTLMVGPELQGAVDTIQKSIDAIKKAAPAPEAKPTLPEARVTKSDSIPVDKASRMIRVRNRVPKKI